MMIKALLGFLLCSVVLGVSTYSYTFSAQATSAAVQPSYSLGTLTENSTVAITLQLPSPNGASLGNLAVSIMDKDNTISIQTLSFSGLTSTVYWIVPANGSYYLKMSGSTANVVMYYLAVTVNNNAILRVVDVIRNKVQKYFYIAPTDTGTVTVTGPTTLSSITLLTMSSTNQFLTASSGTLTGPTTSSGFNTYTVTGLASGYYTLIFASTTVVSVTVTFQGSSYACPYDSNFADYYSVFTGCVAKSSYKYNGLPCTAFDPLTFDCTACLSGYTLNNGYCVTAIKCGAREYIHYGSCYSVNPDCGQFDLYTGACITCLSTTSTVVNGLCVANTVPVCANGTHLYNTQCINDKCTAVDAAGLCTACSSSAFYLENGTCNQIVCGEGKYFSTLMNSCTSIPAGCLSVDPLTQICGNCTNGYFKNSLNNNSCEKPDYSSKCEEWDFVNGKCKLCSTGYYWNIYLCILNIANNCSPGQVIIQNQCVNLPDNCLSINDYRICTQCAAGYQMMAGECKKCNGINPNYPCATCPLNQYVDATGTCRLASAYCATINQLTGLCNSCTSGAAPVGGVCCATGQSVVNGACQQGGSPSTPSTVPKDDFATYYQSCLYYNSAKKICTECRSGHYFDYADHCA